jgi:hypothetical protein
VIGMLASDARIANVELTGSRARGQVMPCPCVDLRSATRTRNGGT